MRIERKRYVVMRKNRTEVWCGLAKAFSFRPISEIKDVSVKTYRSEAQARSGCSSWDRDFEVVPVIEMIAAEQIGEVFLDKVRSMPTLAPPNEPLTLEELREMDGEPVWSGLLKRWGLVKVSHCGIGILTKCGEYDVTRMKLYRRPPEGEENHDGH